MLIGSTIMRSRAERGCRLKSLGNNSRRKEENSGLVHALDCFVSGLAQIATARLTIVDNNPAIVATTKVGVPW